MGGAVISRGRLYHGATSAAGEIGHAPVVRDGDPCRCGQRGCLETMAGGWGIVRRAGQLVVRPARSASGPAEEGPLTTEAVFEAAAGGDPAAAGIIRGGGGFLGEG